MFFTSGLSKRICVKKENIFVNSTYVNHSKGSDVGATIFEIIKIDRVTIKTGQEEGISLTDQSNLLTLLQNFLQNVLLTIKNNQVGLRQEDFL